MSANEKLLAVFRVEKQIRGLSSRIRAAERFFDEQKKQLGMLSDKLGSLGSQHRQLQASISEREGEIARLDERMGEAREKMNSSRTNKEYQALLVEVNTQKIERGKIEEEVIGKMTEAESLSAELEGVNSQIAERETLKKRAAKEKSQREAESADRLAELRAERERVAAECRSDHLSLLEGLIEERGDEAMASIEVMDKRRHEISCGACMMALPVQILNGLLSGEVTLCPNCGCLLYIDEAAVEKLAPAAKR
ncbi:MAG: C4-type zinc ribbon domain-containing protein [Planctomycetota bacterium]